MSVQKGEKIKREKKRNMYTKLISKKVYYKTQVV